MGAVVLTPSVLLSLLFVSVILQLEQLTQLVQKLTARIASEEDSRELLRAQLDEAYAASSQSTQIRTIASLLTFPASGQLHTHMPITRKLSCMLYSLYAYANTHAAYICVCFCCTC